MDNEILTASTTADAKAFNLTDYSTIFTIPSYSHCYDAVTQFSFNSVDELIGCAGQNFANHYNYLFGFDGTEYPYLNYEDTMFYGMFYSPDTDRFYATDRINKTIYSITISEPTNITVDTGNDGISDYTYSGKLNSTVSFDLNITAINNYLQTCSYTNDLCSVPINITTDTGGIINSFNLTVLYESDIYANNVHANQFYGKNSTIILSFDDPLDNRFDSDLAKSITVENKDGNDIFIMPEVLYTWINGERYFDYNKWWAWLTGAIKEYAYRLDWIENGLQLHDQEIADLKIEIAELKKNCACEGVT